MATATLTPADPPVVAGFALDCANWSGLDSCTLTGGATAAICIASDDVATIDVVATGSAFVVISLESDVSLAGVTINSIQVRMTMTTNVAWDNLTDPAFGYIGVTDNAGALDADDIFVLTGPGTYTSPVLATNPSTGNPWLASELVWDGLTPEGQWFVGLSGASNAQFDYFEVIVDYTAGADQWWFLGEATGPFLKPGTTINGTPIDWPIFDGTIDGETVIYNAPDQFITICGVQYPLATTIETPDCGTFDISGFFPYFDFSQTYNWYYYGLPPTAAWIQQDPADQGWWWSVEGFAGGSPITVEGRPANPRTYTQIADFATGNAGVFGGSPGVGVVYNNHLIYAGDDYSQGDNESPTIRTFDGLSDRLLVRIPNTTSGAVPKAVLSMLAANGVIYVSTLDSGTSAADFAGRVFELNPLSAQLSVVGDAVFTTGHLPYALAWHMGRLWVGTNKGDGTSGKIYYFRPHIDTTWTLDYNLTTSTTGGACSMTSHRGKLLIGTDNIDANFAKVIIRNSAGVYSTSTTGTGGTAKVNNGWYAMAEIGGYLYASFFNNDATAISKIYQWDDVNTAWTLVYTGAGVTLRPFIAMFVEANSLYVLGGGLGLTAALLSTPDGSVWTDLTAFLTGTSTAVPIFGTVSL